MPTNSCSRYACASPDSADDSSQLPSDGRLAYLLLLAMGVMFCPGLNLFAQTSDSSTTTGLMPSWTSTTDMKTNHVNPTRVIENHSQSGNLTVDERSIQGRGLNGNFEVVQDIETKTLQVDAGTVRTTTRVFGRGADGRKTLVGVTEEEKHSLPSGDSRVLRISSNLDLDGRLQPFQREIVETKKIGNDREEIKTTVLVPSVSGGMAPSFQTHELRTRDANGTVKSQKTTLVPDGAGNWQVSEVRQNNTTNEANNRSTEERVLRRDDGGKLVESFRTVSRESQNTSGETRTVEETYSVDVPGTTRDGSLHLVERKTNTVSANSSGARTAEQKVEQLNPGDPGSGLRISILVNDTVRPGPSGEQGTRTIRMRDLNGSFAVVSVDTTKSDRASTIEVGQMPSEKRKSGEN